MSNYEIKKVRERKLGRATETVTLVKRKDNKRMTPTDTIKLYKDVMKEAEGVEGATVYIRAMTGTGYKTFNDPDMIEEDLEDYWMGKVKDSSKFTDFEFVEFYIRK